MLARLNFQVTYSIFSIILDKVGILVKMITNYM